MRFWYVQIATSAHRSQIAEASIEVLVGTLRLKDHNGGKWLPRQVDGEHASSPRQVARIDPALIRFRA
jgi:hypothetical protein